MKAQKFRTLLFDLGNVIIDLDIDKTVNELGKLFRPDGDRSIVERINKEYECGRVSTEIFINTILSQCNRNAQAIDIIEAWNGMLVGIPEHRLDMLQSLRENYNVYLLSNTNELHLEWVHRHLKRVHGVDDFEKRYFDHAYYSHLLGDRKPLLSIFKYVIDDSFLTPSLTLYMDDVQENLDAAKKLGFETYLVKDKEDIAEYLKAEGFY